MTRRERGWVVRAAVLISLLGVGGTATANPTPTDQFGGSGSGWVAQCTGKFPDWISPNPPAAGGTAFELSQAFPTAAPAPATDAEAPWQAFDFRQPAERMAYINAIRDYALDGMTAIDFVPQKMSPVRWFHVPMMTTDPLSRREPYHGVTKERPLRADDHAWIIDGAGNDLDAFAVGLYNARGAYTIGQVFADADPQKADPAAATFIPGAMVFKLLFAEYDATKIDPATNPLDGAPEWEVQDVQQPNGPLKKVRLLQVDVAVRDIDAAPTGWVFGTFVYDESQTAEVDPWRRLAPIGLQWGNDFDVTGVPNEGVLDETWINPAIPTVFKGQLGRDGRLNGPVDNPRSSCLSCHSTAQIKVGETSLRAFRAVSLVPPTPCTDAQDMHWFRDVPAGTAFDVMTGNGCVPASPPVGTPPLYSLDYSLQLADGLESALFYRNPNPCAAVPPPPPPPPIPNAAASVGSGASRRVGVDAAVVERLRTERDPEFRR